MLYAFAKLLWPLVKYWWREGLRVLIYLDDGIIAVSDNQAAMEASDILISGSCHSPNDM